MPALTPPISSSSRPPAAESSVMRKGGTSAANFFVWATELWDWVGEVHHGSATIYQLIPGNTAGSNLQSDTIWYNDWHIELLTIVLQPLGRIWFLMGTSIVSVAPNYSQIISWLLISKIAKFVRNLLDNINAVPIRKVPPSTAKHQQMTQHQITQHWHEMISQSNDSTIRSTNIRWINIS